MPNTILDVIRQAKFIDVPGFRRVTRGSCYNCQWVQTDLRRWHCAKFNIIFGAAGDCNELNSIANQAEFICDDFEPMIVDEL